MEVEETAVTRQSRGADPGAVENKNDIDIVKKNVTILTSWASPEW